MNTKLTLTIEQTTIEKAKEDDTKKAELTPIVKSLKGSFKAPTDFDYKNGLSKRILEKYL